MKEIEKLLKRIDDGDNQDVHEEIRKRIADKDTRIAELEKFYKHTHKVEYVAGITRPYEQKIAELEAQVEKLKCTSFMIDDHLKSKEKKT